MVKVSNKISNELSAVAVDLSMSLSPQKLLRGIMESPAYGTFVCLSVCYHDN